MACFSLLYIQSEYAGGKVVCLFFAGGDLALLARNPVAPKLCLSNTFHLISLVLGVR